MSNQVNTTKPCKTSKTTGITVSTRRIELSETLLDQGVAEFNNIHSALNDVSQRTNWLAVVDGLREIANKIETSILLDVNFLDKCPECGHRFKTHDYPIEGDVNPTDKYLMQDDKW